MLVLYHQLPKSNWSKEVQKSEYSQTQKKNRKQYEAAFDIIKMI